MPKFLQSILAVWNMASPTKRRWLIMGGGIAIGIALALWLF